MRRVSKAGAQQARKCRPYLVNFVCDQHLYEVTVGGVDVQLVQPHGDVVKGAALRHIVHCIHPPQAARVYCDKNGNVSADHCGFLALRTQWPQQQRKPRDWLGNKHIQTATYILVRTQNHAVCTTVVAGCERAEPFLTRRVLRAGRRTRHRPVAPIRIEAMMPSQRVGIRQYPRN